MILYYSTVLILYSFENKIWEKKIRGEDNNNIYVFSEDEMRWSNQSINRRDIYNIQVQRNAMQCIQFFFICLTWVDTGKRPGRSIYGSVVQRSVSRLSFDVRDLASLLWRTQWQRSNNNWFEGVLSLIDLSIDSILKCSFLVCLSDYICDDHMGGGERS